MKEDMDILETMVADINDFCNERGIEYVFSAASKDGKYTTLASNEITNVILKKSLEVLRTIVKF